LPLEQVSVKSGGTFRTHAVSPMCVLSKMRRVSGRQKFVQVFAQVWYFGKTRGHEFTHTAIPCRFGICNPLQPSSLNDSAHGELLSLWIYTRCCSTVLPLKSGLTGPSGGPGRCLICMKFNTRGPQRPPRLGTAGAAGSHVRCFHTYEAPLGAPDIKRKHYRATPCRPSAMCRRPPA
jgi:hypothetical protein